MELPDNVNSLQTKLLGLLADKADKASEQGKQDVFDFIKYILSYDKEVACYASGDEFMQVLSEFADRYDLSHPDIEDVILTFTQESIRDKSILEYLDIAEYIYKKNTSAFRDDWRRLGAHKIFRNLQADTERLRSESISVRFLKNKDELTKARAAKKPKRLNPTAISSSTTVEDFMRYGNRHQKELDQLQFRHQLLESQRYTSMLEFVEQRLVSLKTIVNDNYRNFQRIDMRQAAMLSAIQSGFVSVGPELQASKKKLNITISNHRGDAVAGRLISYPIVKTDNTKMSKVLENLDNFKEINGKPMFDHYVIVMPTLQVSEGHGDCIVDDQVVKLSNKEHSEIDRVLVERNRVTPLLLGERESKMYLISLWEGTFNA